MAVAPKQLLAKNVPLIVAYALAIVPIVLWVVLVSGGVKGKPAPRDPKREKPPSMKWDPVSFNEASAALKQITNDVDGLWKKIDKVKKGAEPKEPVYTVRHKKRFEDRNADLQNQAKTIGELFVKRQDTLLKWFDRFKATDPKKEPAYGDFVDEWKAQIAKLGQENAKLVGWDGKGSPNLYSESNISNSPGALRAWQKRFQIQNEIIEALKATASNAVAEVKLGSPIAFEAGGGSAPAPGQPKRPFELIPAKFGAVVSIRDIPKLVRELLAREIVFRLVKLDLELMDFQYDRSKEIPGPPPLKVNENGAKKYFDRGAYECMFANDAEAPQTEAAEEKLVPEPPVKVDIALEAYDFDIEAISPPPAAPAAPADPGEKTPPEKTPGEKPK